MKDFSLVLIFIALAALCWGGYGPVILQGQSLMEGSRLRPFVCVGVAYFIIAVLVPMAILYTKGERGRWTGGGMFWSLAAGAAGALGALGIILAFSFHGNPVYVMPLVFGCAPVVNTFYTMVHTKTFKQANPIFFAGLILVVIGAVLVLVFKPAHHGAAAVPLSTRELALVAGMVAMTALSWGVYGPVLHQGQSAMEGSRLRPLICVGLSYFVIAVVGPLIVLSTSGEQGSFTVDGSLWSLAGGAAGAIGALGIIMAFNFGGKPIYVMPLVFGCAPVINTFITIGANLSGVSPIFIAALILVVAGAVTVLVFAPRPARKAAAPITEKEATAAAASH